MDISTYIRKQYGPQPCWELVADVLASEGRTVEIGYRTVNRSVREMANAFRIAIHRCAHGYQQVSVPSDFDIVLLSRKPAIGIHHCGIWFDGKVLHAEPTMTWYEEESAVRARYPLVEFWSRA